MILEGSLVALLPVHIYHDAKQKNEHHFILPQLFWAAHRLLKTENSNKNTVMSNPLCEACFSLLFFFFGVLYYDFFPGPPTDCQVS